MTDIWTQAAVWLALALVATLASIWLRVATALSEIVVGTIAQLVIGAALGSTLLAGDASWLKFIAGAGAILLTFLAGAELDPGVFRRQWKQATESFSATVFAQLQVILPMRPVNTGLLPLL